MKLTIRYIVEHEQELWKSIRWSDKTPTCSCGSTDLYHCKDGRYKCKHCKKIFSDTSETIMKHSSLQKWQWLYVIFTLSTTRSISVRELAKHIGVSVTTSYKMLRKVRYYMGLDKISLTNIAIIDEAHLGAWANMSFRKKFKYMKEHGFMNPKDNTYTKHQIFAASSDKKEHIVCLVNEYNQCVIKHIRGQVNRRVIKTIIKDYKVSHVISDESRLYTNLPNCSVEQCNHSKGVWLTPNGNTTNPCENRFSWVKRIYECYHTHTSPNDLQLYLNQVAFKINHTGWTTEDIFTKLGKLCCSRHISQQGISEYLRETEIVNERQDIDPQLLEELLNNPMICSIEHKHKIYK